MPLSHKLFNREFAKSVPITLGEFQTSLSKSKPPTGWGNRLAVAFSGGVDSTCLLHLLNQVTRESDDAELRKLSLLALHVDHGFQNTSTQMAAACESFASQRSIAYRTLKIPWWEPPYPPLPTIIQGSGVEEIARAARYNILFDAMTREGVSVLLVAHHLDDQIETGLMRIARGSGIIGASGMRPVRRWGMGSIKGAGSVNEELERWFYGVSGMRRWVSRPLLEFTKVRLRATLEANKLPHIEDVTNANPTLTPRNAIRDSLRKRKEWMEYPTFIRTPLAQQVVNNFARLTRVRDEIDQHVDAYISANRIPSPPSTLAVKNTLPPEDVNVRHAILLRILRYVSPRPWGSLDAEAGRREASLSRMEPMVWPPEKGEGQNGLTAGGYVHWKRISPAKKVDKPVQIDLTAQVQPLPHPYLDSVRKKISLEDNPMQPPITIELFDNRFSIVFSRRFLTRVEWTRILEKQVSSLVILKLGGKWQLPQVVLRRPPDSGKRNKAARKEKRKEERMPQARLRIEDETEEEGGAGVELLPPPAARGFTLDAQDGDGDWVLWSMSENPAESGDDEGIKWNFVRVLDVI